MMVLRYAWRNIWRNPRRTAITVAAIGLNAAILIISYSLMDGMMAHTVANATNLVTGEVQVHGPGYLADLSLYNTLKDPEAVLRSLAGRGIPAAARGYGYGLVARGSKSAGALFWGVQPATERAVFQLAGHTGRGRFLPDEARKRIVLGKKLARSLDADLGSELVAVVQAADGSLGNDLFVVTGILKAAGDQLDRNAAILHRDDFERLFVAGGRIHEIALNSRGEMPLAALAAAAREAAPGEEVKTWRQLMPALSDMVNLMDAGMWIFGMIFFLAAALGVMNTMLMATFERIREFGILKTLGATPWRILRDVTAEAFVLALVSNLLGALLGVAVSYYLQLEGLDMTRFATGDVSVAGVAFDPVWRCAMSPKTVLLPLIVMWAVCLIASLYPAAIAARLDPVRALNHV